MKILTRQLASVMIISALVACGSKVNVDTGQIKGATEDVKASSENFKEGMAKAAEGLKGLDLTGVKTLYADDKELRANLDALKKAIVSVDSPGNVGIGPTTHAIFEITGYSGRLRVDAWLDDEESKFIQDRMLLKNEAQLDISYNYADDGINGTYRYCEKETPSNAQGCFFNYVYPNKARQIDANYRDAVAAALAKFIGKPFFMPSTEADMKEQSFDQRFRQSGKHKLFIRITPEALDAGGNWILEYKAYTVGPDAIKRNFFVGQLDSGKYKNFVLGNAMEPVLVNTFDVIVTDK